jgi:RecA-family ATPase
LNVPENIDANDDLRLHGEGSVAAAMRCAESVVQPFAPLPDEITDDEPLPGCVDAADWSGKEAPHRRFIIPGWLVRGSAGLLSGQEGVGKSLLAQQMMTCAASGAEFLGLGIAPVRAVYITCEDPIEELWRRQEAINKALGISMASLGGRLLLVSLKGQIGNELGAFDEGGRLSPSLRYRQIKAKLIEFGAGLATLDNAAHLFAGNENARHDVAAFLGLLEQLSEAIDGAVLLLAHPNKQHAQGNKQGNEYSGSTGWSAHVRNRLFLDWAEVDGEGNSLGGDGRLLRKSKANYGKRGEEVTFRWHDWAFVTDEQMGPDLAARAAQVASDSANNEIFLRCLDKAMAERRPTSASSAAANYAPRVFAKMPIARNTTAEALEQALQRLLHLGEVIGDARLWQRPNSRHWAIGLARKEAGSGV